MRKIIVIFAIVFTLPNILFSQDYELSRLNTLLEFNPPAPKRFWATVSYAGIVGLGNKQPDVASKSKVGFNAGGTFWKGLGVELSLKSYIQDITNLDYPEINERLITSLGQLDAGVKAVFRPSFMVDDFPMMFISPFIGAGANFSYIPSYSFKKYPESLATHEGIYPSVKVGLHFSALNFLIGASVEYIYQQAVYENEFYDFSNISIGIEIGAAF